MVSRRRVALTITVLLAASVAVQSTRASFVARAAEPLAASTATISLSSAQSGQMWMPMTEGLRPGSTRVASVTVRNDSPVTARLRLRSTSATGSAALMSAIQMQILRTSPAALTVAATQTASALNGVVMDAGSLASGASATYQMTITWPSANNNSSTQDASTSLTYTWELASS